MFDDTYLTETKQEEIARLRADWIHRVLKYDFADLRTRRMQTRHRDRTRERLAELIADLPPEIKVTHYHSRKVNQ